MFQSIIDDHLKTARLEIESDLSTYGSGKSAKTATYFYAVLLNTQKEPFLPVNPQLGHPEHEEWRWVQTDHLQKIMPDRLKKIVARVESYFD